MQIVASLCMQRHPHFYCSLVLFTPFCFYERIRREQFNQEKKMLLYIYSDNFIAFVNKQPSLESAFAFFRLPLRTVFCPLLGTSEFLMAFLILPYKNTFKIWKCFTSCHTRHPNAHFLVLRNISGGIQLRINQTGFIQQFNMSVISAK